MKKLAIGVDIGGSNIRAALVSANGKILKTSERKTERTKSRIIILKNIVNTIRDVYDKRVTGIGVGSPGPLDLKSGKILSPRNLKSLNNFNLKKALQKEFRKKIVINNDANCYILGEKIFGAGKKQENILGFTLGTGLGCCLIINSKLYTGSTGTAAEIAKNRFRQGLVEDYVSGRGIMVTYKGFGGKAAKTAEQVAKRVPKGCKKAKRTFEEFGKNFALAIHTLVNLVDPSMIIVGGQISKSYYLFEKSFKRELYRNINKETAKKLKIVKSGLGDNAGVLGAASLAL